ncbi:MAG: phosphoglycerate kinase [Roseivirga sp.]
MRYVQDYNFQDKKALIRVDFNVPLDEHLRVVDDTRIRGAIPTIQQVLHDGGAAVLMSHLGRPQRGYQRSFSLQHLLPSLSEALGREVAFASSCIGPEAQTQVQQLSPGEVLLLENVRFQAGETIGAPELAQALAAWGDVFVNDAFGTLHRAHASTAVIAQYFTDKLAGHLVQQELKSADKVLTPKQKPLTALIGGGKVADKINPIAHLLDRVDYLLIGGAVAHTFQQALGGQVGASLVEPDQVAVAQQLVKKAQQKGVRLVFPTDVVAARQAREGADTMLVDGGAVPADWMALDIGPQTQQAFAAIIQASQTVLWCGPMGVFEIPHFRAGTHAVAAAVAQATASEAFSLIGGGDSAAAIQSLGYADQVSHISTGGSALLAYLGGEVLPGIQALD